MADGDPWHSKRIACDYVADDGATYRYRVLEKYQAQAGLGWVACTNPLLKRLPSGIKPRCALTFDAGAHANRRRVVVATNAAYIAMVPGTTTLKVQQVGSAVEDTYTVYGLEGERTRGVEVD